jgi:RND family efflux transporter MFP subunit
MTDNKKADLNALQIDKSKKFNDRPKSKIWFWLLWAFIIIVLCVSFFAFKNKITPATQVKTTEVKLLTGDMSQASLVASGYVVAQRKAEVASKGTGRLKYLGFEEGDTVLANQIIAEIENDDIKANLHLAEANLAKAEVDSLNSGRIYKRAQSLFNSGSITRADYELAESNYMASLAQVEASVASVNAANVDLGNTFIKAPFSGTILTKNADVGEIVAPFASSASSKGSVVTLADMNSLEVEADVSESNIYKVNVGQECSIILDAYPNRSYKGYVKKIVPTADRSRATVLTKVAFKDRDDRVLPEMSARINFLIDDKNDNQQYQNSLVVNKETITSRDGSKVVFRIIDNKVEMVTITIGRELGDLTEVLDGISQGDQIVLNPPGKMTNGDKIEISK